MCFINNFHPIKWIKSNKLNILGFIFLGTAFFDILSQGEKLNNTHFLFLITAVLLFSFSKYTLNHLLYLFRNINKIKKGDWEIEVNNRTTKLKESIEANKDIDTKDIKVPFEEISALHQRELSIAALKYLLNQIDLKFRVIYKIVFKESDLQEIRTLDGIMIFETLRRQDILNNDFCSLIYEFCTIANKFIFDFDTIESVNDLKIDDLIYIGNDLLSRLDNAIDELSKNGN